jgi:23S rRNA (uracil1939-C5)-methyltransferase
VDDLAERIRGGSLNGVTQVELAENLPASERALHVELDRPATPMGLSDLARLPTMVGVSASFGASSGTGRGRGGQPASWRRTVTVGGTPCVLDTLVLQVPDGEAVREVELKLQHHAEAFFQGNRYLLAPLASRVVSLVPAGPVVDLYAGVGLFSASLAAAGWTSIVAVEGDRASSADLRANASPFGSALVPVEASVEHYLEAHPVGAEATIIVDPPRTGMSKQAATAIASQAASRLIYVSCDVATFARDSRRLLDAGYRLEHLEAFDLFPNTAHVEALAVFTNGTPR